MTIELQKLLGFQVLYNIKINKMSLYIDKLIDKTIRQQLNKFYFTLEEQEKEDVKQQSWIYLLRTAKINKHFWDILDKVKELEEFKITSSEEAKEYWYLNLTVLTWVQKGIEKVKQFVPKRYKKNEEGKNVLQKNNQLYKYEFSPIEDVINEHDIEQPIDYIKETELEEFYKYLSKIITTVLVLSNDSIYKDVYEYFKEPSELRDKDNKNRKLGKNVIRFFENLENFILSLDTDKKYIDVSQAELIWEKMLLNRINKKDSKILESNLFKEFKEIVEW